MQETPAAFSPAERDNNIKLANCRRPHDFKQRNRESDNPYNCMECVRCGGRVSLEWAYGYRHGLADATGADYAHTFRR